MAACEPEMFPFFDSEGNSMISSARIDYAIQRSVEDVKSGTPR